MNEELDEDAKFAVILLDTKIKEIAKLRQALKSIEEKKHLTLLGHCCVDKTCQPVYDGDEKIDSCAHRYGVNRGYQECARIAKEALDEKA